MLNIELNLTNLGQMWPKYLPLATFAYNTFNTPYLGNYSPHELVFDRKPKVTFEFRFNTQYQSFQYFQTAL